MKKVSPYWFLALLATVCFTLATLFVPRAGWWNDARSAKDWNGQSQSDDTFKLLFGEGRRLFANQFYVMADVYFHSGYYPSMFDRQEQDRDVADPALGKTEDTDSTSDDFLGPPPDWIAALDRHFVPNRHTHLIEGGPSGHMKATSVQEILPWLKLASDMNPQMIDTYTVAAYYLSGYLNDPNEAREFLREGLRNNPGNYELLFNLGQLYYGSYHDTARARNVWKAALRKWQAQSDADKKDNKKGLDQITMYLGHLEENAGNWNQAIHYFEMATQVSPNPGAIQKQIDEIKARMAARPPDAPTNSIH
ncbi:MAG: tetratricopeptide repeat protein [Limisphaerales bacterium]